ncbi:hypothetical protein N7488_007674 [Penicillium malachiteum]|nr:hypothetical protein N7488_007674 [Penicillium malachiteum]
MASRFQNSKGDHGVTEECSVAETYEWHKSLYTLCISTKTDVMSSFTESDPYTTGAPLLFHHKALENGTGL